MNNLIKGVIPALLLVLLGAGCAAVDAPVNPNPTDSQPTETTTMDTKTYEAPTVLPADRIENKQVRIKTAKGDVVIALYPDTAPLTVSNFISLIEQNYYDGIVFHRRVEGFVVQGGDPSGDGTGGPGYTFEDELEDQYDYSRGRVAMANRGPNTNGSQFFIMLDDNPLPKAYSIFGEVIEGMDVVDRLEIGDEMISVTIEDVASEGEESEVADDAGFVSPSEEDETTTPEQTTEPEDENSAE